jgi:predicted metalloenzyme YecM
MIWTPLRRRYRPLCEVHVNTETLLDLSKKVGMEIYANKIRHIVMSTHQNTRQSHDVNITNRSLMKYGRVQMRNDITSKNYVQEEIRI